MELANPIPYEVTTGITQLVEFLARVVKVYFGKDMPKERTTAVGVAIGNMGNNTIPAIELVPEENSRQINFDIYIMGTRLQTQKDF